jgi:signal transduction histidine kinase
MGLVLLGGTGYIVVRVVDHQMHDNARAEALRALDTARAQVMSGNIASTPDLDAPPVEIGSGPQRSTFIDPVLSRLDLSVVPPGQLYVTRQTVVHDTYYIAVFRSDDSAEPYTLATAAPLADIERTVTALRRGVFAAVLALSALLAMVAAIVTNRALRPVAAMRSEADAISHGTLDRRLATDTSAAELAALGATINRMLDRLESSATAQRQFTSDASHELRSPLTTIRAQLELALATPDNLQQRCSTMLAEIDRLDLIVGDLLALSRADESTVARHPVDLDEVVTDHAARLRRDGLRIDLTDVEHVQLDGDERLLTSLVRNLLDNAARHARTTITVSLEERPGRTLHLVVDDDGPGIPTELRRAVFERFTRLDDDRGRDRGGAGLGLAVAMAAARAHDGTIEITDAPSGGARLHVTLRADLQT